MSSSSWGGKGGFSGVFQQLVKYSPNIEPDSDEISGMIEILIDKIMIRITLDGRKPLPWVTGFLDRGTVDPLDALDTGYIQEGCFREIPEVFLCSLKGNVQEDRPYHRHRWGFSPIFTNPLG